MWEGRRRYLRRPPWVGPAAGRRSYSFRAAIALEQSGKDIPVEIVTIGLRGEKKQPAPL